ncbi:MAG: hypothetical protein JSS84_15005 [Bacteroidetes bacterium]|nr:hypothetical protein [Bacteroidota bacterium]
MNKATTFVPMNTKSTYRRVRFHATLTTQAKKRLRRISEEEDRSMSAILNDIIMSITLGTSRAKRDEAGAQALIARNLGALKDKVRPEDWDRDDRIGDMLRKYARQ